MNMKQVYLAKQPRKYKRNSAAIACSDVHGAVSNTEAAVRVVCSERRTFIFTTGL